MPVYKKDIVPAYNSWTREQRELEKEKGNPIKSMYTSRGIPLSDELVFEKSLHGIKKMNMR